MGGTDISFLETKLTIVFLLCSWLRIYYSCILQATFKISFGYLKQRIKRMQN